MNDGDIKQHLSGLVSSTARLCELLQRERRALIGRDHQQLQQILDDKRDVCADIDRYSQALGPVPLPEQLESCSGQERTELDRLHTSLLELADRAQEYNAVNGKIVRRSQQSVRDLIHIISGMDAEVLYGHQGQTMASAQGTAIARA